MTTSADIREAIVTALTGNTDAGGMVVSPWDWSIPMRAYPHILVRNTEERKESWGPNAPSFTVIATIEIIARTKFSADISDTGSTYALRAVELLKHQIEVQLINNPEIWTLGTGANRVQEFRSVHTRLSTSSDGDMPIAEAHMSLEVAFIQTPDDFFPIPGVPLENFTGTVPEPEGTVEPTFSITFPNPIS